MQGKCPARRAISDTKMRYLKIHQILSFFILWVGRGVRFNLVPYPEVLQGSFRRSAQGTMQCSGSHSGLQRQSLCSSLLCHLPGPSRGSYAKGLSILLKLVLAGAPQGQIGALHPTVTFSSFSPLPWRYSSNFERLRAWNAATDGGSGRSEPICHPHMGGRFARNQVACHSSHGILLFRKTGIFFFFIKM